MDKELNIPFLGREKELGKMLEAYEDVREGRGVRILTLVAPSGYGKTRLIHEFYSKICSNEIREKYGDSAYWPEKLCDDPSRIEVNPVIPSYKVMNLSLPWLWLGMRWIYPEGKDKNSYKCGLEDAIKTLNIHIEPLLRARGKEKAIKDFSGKGFDVVLNALGMVPIIGSISSYSQLVLSLGALVKAGKEAVNRCRQGKEPISYSDIETEHNLKLKDIACTYMQLFLDPGNKECPTVPVVIVLDDAQWADKSTLFVLHTIACKAVENNWKLLVIATYLKEEWEEKKTETKNTPGGRIEGENDCTSFVRVLNSIKGKTESQSIQEIGVGKLDESYCKEILLKNFPGLQETAKEYILERASGIPLVIKQFMLLLGGASYWFEDKNLSKGISGVYFEVFKNKTVDAQSRADTRIHQIEEVDEMVVEVLKLGAYQGMRFFEYLVKDVAEHLKKCDKEESSAALGVAENPHCVISRREGVATAEFRTPFYRENLLERSKNEEEEYREAFKAVIRDWISDGRIRATGDQLGFCDMALLKIFEEDSALEEDIICRFILKMHRAYALYSTDMVKEAGEVYDKTTVNSDSVGSLLEKQGDYNAKYSLEFFMTYLDYAFYLRTIRKYKEAENIYKVCIDFFSLTNLDVNMTLIKEQYADVMGLRDPVSAIRVMKELLGTETDAHKKSLLMGKLAKLYALTGERHKALELAKELENNFRNEQDVAEAAMLKRILGNIYATLGDMEKASELIGKDEEIGEKDEFLLFLRRFNRYSVKYSMQDKVDEDDYKKLKGDFERLEEHPERRLEETKYHILGLLGSMAVSLDKLDDAKTYILRLFKTAAILEGDNILKEAAYGTLHRYLKKIDEKHTVGICQLPEGNVIIEFKKDSIENLNMLPLIKLFEKHSCIDKIVISINGYDDDSRELYDVEEVRAFFFIFSSICPQWPLFLNIKLGSVTFMLQCIARYKFRLTPEDAQAIFLQKPEDGKAILLKILRDCFERMTEYIKQLPPEVQITWNGALSARDSELCEAFGFEENIIDWI